MSTSQQADQRAGDQVSLVVRTDDPESEIFVVDGQFRLAARGLGRLAASLDPGIYKVKVRTGTETREEHVVLRPEQREVVKAFERLAFPSAAPLDDTAKTHEFHIAAAERE